MKHIKTFEGFVNEGEANTEKASGWVIWIGEPDKEKKVYGTYDDKKKAYTVLNNVARRYYDNTTEVGILTASEWDNMKHVKTFESFLGEDNQNTINEGQSKNILGVEFNVITPSAGVKFQFKDAKQFRKSGISVNKLVDEITKMLDEKFGKGTFTFMPSGRDQADPSVNGLEFKMNAGKLIMEKSELSERFQGAGLQKYVDDAAEQCDNQGGNGENLRQYGLPELAGHIDAYYGANNSSKADSIYTNSTVAAFKKFVDSMVADEIEFNQAENDM